MKPILWLSTFAIVFAETGAAQPQIAASGVLNAASNSPVGWPNSSIAQGSIFTIYGSNLGPSSSPALAYPLQPTLGGVSVRVTSGSTSLSAIPIFVGTQQINVILPASTPVGSAALTVTYNGQTSNAVSFQVIANSFGIFAVNSVSTGVGVITGASHQLYSVNSPANPGDVATLWGTGIGPSSGDDGSAPPPQIDMPNLPLSVYVGSQAATVTYRGRGPFTGEDQINFVIPAGITGCFVPVAVEIGSIVSNFVTMPIAPAGQSCPDPLIPEIGFYPPPPIGTITLTRSTLIGATTNTTDSGQAYFGSETFFVSGSPLPLPLDTCIGGLIIQGGIEVPFFPLDAGPAITITGPNGSQQLAQPNYTAQLGGGSGTNAQPLFLSAGSYSVSGTGGADVGPFSQNFTIPQPLTWTNPGNTSVVDRSAGLDVSWTGGDPNGTVQITGVTGNAAALCNAKISDQHFTIPAFVLLSLPPSTSTSTGSLTLRATSTAAFTASGISSGTINSVVAIVKDVSYH
jgi:uncharacterized protein (TIGR03437 family)